MFAPLALAPFLVASTLAAQPLSQGDRDFAASNLHATRKLFLDTAASATAAQWSFKPAPEIWSLAELGEHIVLSESFIFEIATVRAAKAPLDAAKKDTLSNRKQDETLIKTVPVRDRKFQAPEPLKPTGRFTSRDQVIAAFKSKRDANIAYVLNTGDDLRGHFSPHPAYGDLDAYQWILLMSAHTERHINQMKEVIARPDFPKR